MRDQIEADPYTPLVGAIGTGLAVYCATYDAIAAVELDALQLLDEAETNRARRFVYEGDRERFIIAHAYLRRIAASHSGQSVEDIRLATQENRPPIMLGEVGVPCLQLSLSHCRSRVAVAVSDRTSIGVDVEDLPSLAQCKELASLVCSQHEQTQLSLTDPNCYSLAFCKMWTAKEAVSKALGLGLQMDFAGVSKSSDSDSHRYTTMYQSAYGKLDVHTSMITKDCVLSIATTC